MGYHLVGTKWEKLIEYNKDFLKVKCGWVSIDNKTKTYWILKKIALLFIFPYLLQIFRIGLTFWNFDFYSLKFMIEIYL